VTKRREREKALKLGVWPRGLLGRSMGGEEHPEKKNKARKVIKIYRIKRRSSTTRPADDKGGSTKLLDEKGGKNNRVGERQIVR